MSTHSSETQPPTQGSARAIAAIEQLAGPDKELYQCNRSLAEAFWPEIGDFQWACVARVASELHLDISGEEVIWLRDRPVGQAQGEHLPQDQARSLRVPQGRPYVTIKGLLRLLNRHPQFDNYELEPASDDLRKAMRVVREEEQVWVCRLWRKDRTRPAIGYGRATPEDTFVGYGLIQRDEASGRERLHPATSPAPTHGSEGQVYRTPAVIEMAQERAVRRASQGAFGWEFMSTLSEPASEDHKRVDPENGHVSPLLDDGTPNTVGCTEAQRRAIHSMAGAQGLPEGRVDPESGEVLEEGWRAELY
ncbi:MAG: hypothetical protein IH860_09310, partial [Chloroflexi bacterium]|nr:hypothetical protein [Chloroflexota bacterium]